MFYSLVIVEISTFFWMKNRQKIAKNCWILPSGLSIVFFPFFKQFLNQTERISERIANTTWGTGFTNNRIVLAVPTEIKRSYAEVVLDGNIAPLTKLRARIQVPDHQLLVHDPNTCVATVFHQSSRLFSNRLQPNYIILIHGHPMPSHLSSRLF